MPKIGGKEYDYDSSGIVKARADAIKIVQNPKGHSKKEIADAKAVIAEYAKKQDAKKAGGKKSMPKAPPSRPKMMHGGMSNKKPEFMYGGMANKKKHNYSIGGSVMDNLTPAQKNMVKKMAEGNK